MHCLIDRLSLFFCCFVSRLCSFSLAWLVGAALCVSLRIVSIMSSQPDLDQALLDAAIEGRLEDIRSLLDRGANINAVDTYRNTPLHWASSNGHHQCVELLLDRGANVNGVGPNNRTPLHSASAYGHHQCVELLLDRGANINAVTTDNYTPLHYASIKAQQQCIELLIDRGADKSIESVREDGRDSLLHLLLISTIAHPIHSILSAGDKPQNKLPKHQRLLN